MQKLRNKIFPSMCSVQEKKGFCLKRKFLTLICQFIQLLTAEWWQVRSAIIICPKQTARWPDKQPQPRHANKANCLSLSLRHNATPINPNHTALLFWFLQFRNTCLSLEPFREAIKQVRVCSGVAQHFWPSQIL